MLIIKFIGYLCTIYISLILFPWVFVIFWRTPPPPEKLIIENKELKIQDTFLIKLESERNINPRISSNLKKKLEIRGIINSGSLSSILAKVKDYDESIELKNIRKLYSDKFFDQVIGISRDPHEIFIQDKDGLTICINDSLITEGHAYVYEGGKKKIFKG